MHVLVLKLDAVNFSYIFLKLAAIITIHVVHYEYEDFLSVLLIFILGAGVWERLER